MEITREIVELFLKSHNFPLKPSQYKLCYPKLERIYKRMIQNKDFPPIKVGNGKIIEGHHRYLCSEILAKKIVMIMGGINISQQTNYSWNEIVIETIDWDKDWELKLYKKIYE